MKITADIQQRYVRKGNRLFAIPREQGRAERIASKSNVRGNWSHIMEQGGRARVISNCR